MTPQPQSQPRREPAVRGSWLDEVRLLGGFLSEGGLERVVRFRPVTGHLEREIGAIAASSLHVPDRVTALLAAALESIGSAPVSESLVGELCVSDRRYLILRLATRVGGDEVWLTPECSACRAPFDVKVSLQALPVKPAGCDFPFAAAEVAGETLGLRVATGTVQASLCDLAPEAARGALLAGCIVSVSGSRAVSDFVQRLSAADIAMIDAALDEVSPDVGTLLDASCPECGERQVVELDPYAPALLGVGGLLEEVHTLASTYHWAEQEILGLPRDRRRAYLRLIERARGLYS